MDNKTRILFREIQERYVKVLWTHKIHLCQADILTKKNNERRVILEINSIFVSTAAIVNIFKWIPEGIIVPVFALSSLALTFLTLRFKADNLLKSASDNMLFAALLRNLRNQYALLLTELKSETIDISLAVKRLQTIQDDEKLIFSGLEPPTSAEAEQHARTALKIKKDSTTTDDEIELLVSTNLQLDKER